MDTTTVNKLYDMTNFAPIWTYINTPENTCDTELIDNIDTSIFHSLNVRDALILTTMNENLSYDDITRFLNNPVAPSSTRIAYECLSTMIYNPSYIINTPRIERTIDLMNTLKTRDTNPQFTACAFAVNAYLSWILGNTMQAKSYNRQALEQDKHYTLALITEKALTHRIRPAYLNK